MATTPFPLPIMLNATDRKALRARAHHLEPVVMIGEAGLTRAVLDETDRALRAHELIKVRVLGDDREQRQATSTEICSALGCTAVQSIGKLLVLYRPKPIEDAPATHVPKKRAAQRPSATGKKVTAARKNTGTRKSAGARKTVASGKAATARKSAAAAKGAAARKPPARATEGKRTALAARKPAPARRASASASTQGPSRLRGPASASARGRRDRAKKP
ncbi:MAG: ribosome assembly RNA-binding protein YhbY [Burkholderiaceae bacterium]|nr:ribosome assembly RNA-binding protein YhbY [Burkholderiaceae bacterium]